MRKVRRDRTCLYLIGFWLICNFLKTKKKTVCVIDKIQAAKAEEDDKSTDKLKNLLMFFIGVGVIAFVIPDVLAAVAGCNDVKDLFGMPNVSFFNTNNYELIPTVFAASCDTVGDPFGYVTQNDDSGSPRCVQSKSGSCPSNALSTTVLITINTNAAPLEFCEYDSSSNTATPPGSTSNCSPVTPGSIDAVVAEMFELLLWVIRIGMIFACLAVAAKMSLIRI